MVRVANCWFLAALVGSTSIPHIFNKVVPRDQVSVFVLLQSHSQKRTAGI